MKTSQTRTVERTLTLTQTKQSDLFPKTFEHEREYLGKFKLDITQRRIICDPAQSRC